MSEIARSLYGNYRISNAKLRQASQNTIGFQYLQRISFQEVVLSFCKW